MNIYLFIVSIKLVNILKKLYIPLQGPFRCQLQIIIDNKIHKLNINNGHWQYYWMFSKHQSFHLQQNSIPVMSSLFHYLDLELTKLNLSVLLFKNLVKWVKHNTRKLMYMCRYIIDQVRETRQKCPCLKPSLLAALDTSVYIVLCNKWVGLWQ